jgi:hypothetical protein
MVPDTERMRSAPDGVCIKLLTSPRDNQRRAIEPPSISIRVAPYIGSAPTGQDSDLSPAQARLSVCSGDGAVQARHPCASKEDAEAFLQAFTQGDASGGPGF